MEKGYHLASNAGNVRIIDKPYNLTEELKELGNNSIFILPSKIESVPLALLEALGAGLICISSDTRGGLELIRNKKNGFIFNKNNSAKLENILKAVTTNKKIFNKISKAGKKSVTDKTWDKLAIEIEKEYNKHLLV